MAWADNKDEAKRLIRSGQMVSGNRAIGKTTALMEVIHEDHQGRAVVVNANALLAECFSERYRRMFPEDEKPVSVCCGSSLDRIRGLSGPVYADTAELFPEKFISDLPALCRAVIW